MGLIQGFPWFREDPDSYRPDPDPRIFPRHPNTPTSYGVYLLLSSYGLDFQGKGRRTDPSCFPAGVLAGPENHDLASWNSMSTGVVLPHGQLGERTGEGGGCLCHGGG